VATPNEKRHGWRRADSNDAPAATAATIRANNSPSRDKRANDSGAKRLTHMRWDRIPTTVTSREKLGLWLEPGPFGSRNGSHGLFDKFELIH